MTALELRTSIHNLIDKIEDEDLLVALFDFLKNPKSQATQSLWQSLSDEQKKEVLLSFDDSEKGENLFSKEQFLDML